MPAGGMMPSSPKKSNRRGSAGTSSSTSSSKLEKICELESSLKLSNEENRRLRKEVAALKSNNGSHRSAHSAVSCSGGSVNTVGTAATQNSNASQGNSNGNGQHFVGDFDKMKDALKALKRVTVNQEMSITTMRTKASQRRKELKEKDNTIASLQRKIKSLQKAQKASEGASGGGGGGGSEGQLRARINDLERVLYEEENRSATLADKLEESEMQRKVLQRRVDHPIKKTPSNQSLRSLESASTAAEFDVARLKKELANKANRIVQLEMELEMARDELHELKKHPSSGGGAGTGTASDHGGDFGAFGDHGDGDDAFGAVTTTNTADGGHNDSSGFFESDPFGDDSLFDIDGSNSDGVGDGPDNFWE